MKSDPFDLSKALEGASKQELEGAGYATQIEKNKTTLEAVTLFYNLGAAQSKVASLDLVMVKAEDIVKQIELQMIKGLTYKSDVLLAKANLNHIKIEISRAKEDIKTKCMVDWGAKSYCLTYCFEDFYFGY